MTKQKIPMLLLLALSILLPSGNAAAEGGAADLTGKWYGTWAAELPVGPWASTEFPTGSTFEMIIFQYGSDQHAAVLYIPELDLFDVAVPIDVSGNQIALGDPQFAWGTVSGDSISGIAVVPDPHPPYFLLLEWQVQKPIDVIPGSPPGQPCQGVPLFCTGGAEDCQALLPFQPAIGPGYINYLVKDETWEDQSRSYIRRDLMQLVKYAAARVQCDTADWSYGNSAPLGLGDMSDANGLAPLGFPGHSTHEAGNHIDIAYYQLYATDNLLRPVGRHHADYVDVWYLTEPPPALDALRTALFIAHLSEHPHLRYIIVDWQIGLALEEAFSELEALGWIDPSLRALIPLIYGPGWYRFHHDHMHVAMSLLHPIVSDVEVKPATLNKKSQGKYVIGHVELVAGHAAADIDLSTVALIVDGHTILYAEPSRSRVTDYNHNGVADLTVKFDRKAVTRAIGTGVVEVAITGSVDGKFFQASDSLRVLEGKD